MRSSITLIVVLFLTIDTALSAQWISPDGLVAVTEPEDGFARVDDPPEPFLALWMSADENIGLGVMRMAIRPNIKLIRASAEQGLAEEVNGEITDSSTIVRNGHEIWIMTAEGLVQGSKLRVTQAMIQLDGIVYKVIANVRGDALARQEQDVVESFVDSIQLSRRESASEAEEADEGLDIHYLSKRIGGVSALILIVLVVWWLVNRGKPKS